VASRIEGRRALNIVRIGIVSYKRVVLEIHLHAKFRSLDRSQGNL
jgi:hypothetical protein